MHARDWFDQFVQLYMFGESCQKDWDRLTQLTHAGLSQSLLHVFVRTRRWKGEQIIFKQNAHVVFLYNVLSSVS